MTTTNRTQQTVREMTPAIGASVGVRFESLIIDCTVVDAKNSWGKVRLLVRPAAGVGEQWIELNRLCATAGDAAAWTLVAERKVVGGSFQLLRAGDDWRMTGAKAGEYCTSGDSEERARRDFGIYCNQEVR